MADNDSYLLRWLQVQTLWTKIKGLVSTESTRAQGAEYSLNASIGTLTKALKTETDRAQAAEATKAPQNTTYTKDQVDSLVSPKATIEALNQEIADRKAAITTVEEKITTSATNTLNSARQYADSVATGAMHWKGVITYTELTALTDQKVGDFWTVSDKQNKEYAWTGTVASGKQGWVDIGADVDFTTMQNSIDANKTAISTEKTRAQAAESTLQTNINAKANSADVYDKATADSRFQKAGSYLTGVPDNSVSTVKIQSKAVTTAKIADGAVTATQLASNAVTTAKITDANVTEAKLATDLQTKINGKADSSNVYSKTDINAKFTFITDAMINALA